MPRRNIPQKKKSTNTIIIVGVIAAIVIVGGLVALNAMTSAPATPQVASNTRDWGSPNAPITVVEYSDLQ